jgi:hypothetical protein
LKAASNTRVGRKTNSAIAGGKSSEVISDYAARVGAAPVCFIITGQGFTMRQAEWDLGDGFAFTASYAPQSALSNDAVLPALHSLAVRRRLLRDRLPATGAPNPDEHPTWESVSCDE